MLDSKFFFTLVGLFIALFAINKSNISPAINEGFWGNPTRTVLAQREVHPGNQRGYSLKVNYGANIRYNMPSYKHRGVPHAPLAFGDMAKQKYDVKENYNCNGGCDSGCSGCSTPSCGKGGVNIDVGNGGSDDSNHPTHESAMKKVYSHHTIHENSPTSLVAVGDMTTIDASGATDQPIVYDRYIYANQKSRLRCHGDPIRGDLPIVPCNNGWFNVSVHPNRDLHEGAINVIAGHDNATAKALGDLQYATSGGAETISAGVPMTNQFTTGLGAALGDVNVTSFP
jgi:hypothetical protein